MKRLLVLGALWLAGCTSHGSTVFSETAINLDSRPAIIFIPGFYGSALRTKASGKRIFLTGLQAYFGKDSLSLFQQELGTPKGPDVEPEGVLGAVTVLPGLYEVDVYAPLIHRMRQLNPESQVIPFAYDWRDDLSLAVTKLDELVKTLIGRGCKNISVVSHSMGGLVAEYYLAYGSQPPETAKLNFFGAQIIKKAVFYGTPFNGSMIAFRSFDKGSGLPYSEKLLNADTMSSFPSMYQLIPITGSLYSRNGGAKLSVDIFDPEAWKKNHFGLLRRTTLPEAYLENRDHFTTEWLAKARKFSDLLQLGHASGWVLPKGLQILNVIGHHHDTLNGGYLAEDGKLYFDPEDLKTAGLKPDPLFDDGDGTVTVTSATIPTALESVTKRVEIESGHGELFLDLAADKEYKHFLAPNAKLF